LFSPGRREGEKREKRGTPETPIVQEGSRSAEKRGGTWGRKQGRRARVAI